MATKMLFRGHRNPNVTVRECKHKHRHKGFKTFLCEWCGSGYERPSCWPPEQRFCSSWCAKRFYVKNYSGENSKNFKHGIMSTGYKRIIVDGKRMLEHRHLMEQKLGRKLETYEQVHHINGNKLDNSLENLELWTRSQPSGVRASDVQHCPTCTCGA